MEEEEEVERWRREEEGSMTRGVTRGVGGGGGGGGEGRERRGKTGERSGRKRGDAAMIQKQIPMKLLLTWNLFIAFFSVIPT